MNADTVRYRTRTRPSELSEIVSVIGEKIVIGWQGKGEGVERQRWRGSGGGEKTRMIAFNDRVDDLRETDWECLKA